MAVLTTLLVHTTSAQAQTNYTIQVGAPLFEHPLAGGAPADGMRFYAPDNLRVHPGDTITFEMAGFHTATLIPANRDLSSWARQNAGGTDKPFSLVQSDPDEGTRRQPGLKANPAATNPPFDCGSQENPCNYDRQGVTNSGLPFGQGPFNVKINANPGDRIGVICLIHPRMRLTLQVVSATDPAATQSEIDAYKEAQTAEDAEKASTQHRRLRNKDSSHKTKRGEVVHDGLVGFDGQGFALLDFYPAKMVVRRGQTVRWRANRLIYETHTTTFPRKKGLEVARGDFQPVCDPDGDDGRAPDNPPDTEQPPFCNDPRQLEFDINRDSTYKRGNGVFKRKDYENSGWVGVTNTGVDSFNLEYARSSRKGVVGVCLIHGRPMSVRVVVKPRR